MSRREISFPYTDNLNVRDHRDPLADFVNAYVNERLARPYAVSGNQGRANKYYQLARQVGDSIKDGEEKSMFLGNLQGGDWFGVLQESSFQNIEESLYLGT